MAFHGGPNGRRGAQMRPCGPVQAVARAPAAQWRRFPRFVTLGGRRNYLKSEPRFVAYLAPLNLSSASGEKLLGSIARLASAELVALTGRLSRLFTIASPFAPGLCCIGGEIMVDADLARSSGVSR